MNVCLADLHVHTALSPCADGAMTPPLIVGAALTEGLGMIAVCDHNSARNVAAVQEAAGDHGDALAGGLLHGGDVAGAVVVADGDHAEAFSDRRVDDRRRRHLAVRAGRQRRVDVQVCEADVHA